MKDSLTVQQRQKIRALAQHTIDGAPILPDEAVQLTLEEFREAYNEMVDYLGNRNPTISLAHLSGGTMVIVPQYSDQLFWIAEKDNRFLSPNDFVFVLKKQEYGILNKPDSYGKFLISEFRLYWKWLVAVFVVCGLSLHFAGDKELYNTLIALLIQSATVFLSIFLIFTVTQSSLIQKDSSLFKQGLLHRYRNDDKYIALTSIIIIGMVFANSIFLSLDPNYFRFVFQGYPLGLYNLWGALSTSIIVMMLLGCFITVVGYYLERSQSVADRDMVREVLTGDREKFKSNSSSS